MSEREATLIDARGHRCPVPSLLLRRALRGAAPGAAVTLVADDPMARIDVPHLCAQVGARVLSIETVGATLTFTVAAAD